MEKYTLITGATSGIGYEMAKIMASKGHHLILVARNMEKLEEIKSLLKGDFDIKVVVLVADLSNVEEAIDLYDRVKELKLHVEYLINNAGIGDYGNFIEMNMMKDLKMIELNVFSVLALTKLFAKDMVLNKHGSIMNIASLLSFLPFPYYSVYSATKSFVLAFSETVNAELQGTGVMVKALCPGPIDTAFNSADMLRTNAYKANKPMSAEVVAMEGVKLLLNNKSKKIVGFNNWFISNLPRVTPDGIMMKIKKNLASQAK